MTNSFHSLSIDQELANIKIDSHWDDDTIISFYKKKAREICARLEAEEKVKKKELLLSNTNNNYVQKNIKMLKLKRPNSSYKINSGSFRSQSGNNSKLIKRNRITSANSPPIISKKEEPESVLNMLFPYVNENDFKIEPFKSGAELRKEYLEKRQNTPIIRVNLEQRIKSNFVQKFKQYDKYLNTYAKNPSIRCSSAYITDEERRRKEFIKSKKLWVTTDDFKRYFGKNENEKNREIHKIKNEKYIPNQYVEPYLANVYRFIDKNKWMSKKNFVV